MPAQGAVGNAKPPRETLHRGGLARRFSPQAVIDRDRNELGRAL
jgi:hypothetical protein